MPHQMEFTGERMVPQGASDSTFWEHVERYRFASRFVRGKTVLDIACGEGYGSAAMSAAGALSVVGIDISPEAVEHARAAYGIDARVGSAEEIPLPTASIDTIISFETIEHLQRPEAFVRECGRVLVPDGALLISTPNIEVYRNPEAPNPFHCSELTVQEFEQVLRGLFDSVKLYGQCIPARWFMHTRGFGRTFRLAKKLLIPNRDAPLTADLRSRVVDLCRQSSSWVSQLLALESVRSVNDADLAKSIYVVAIARQPRV